MKKFLQNLGFHPKENAQNILEKIYKNNYKIEIDFEKEIIKYGNKITQGRKTTQNFKDEENFVVLDCVDKLLEKGYNPEDIILEKGFPAGHGVTKYLDILVKKDGKSFLMIECKTWGKEFEKEFKAMQRSEKNQLFTYFQQDRDTDFLILFSSNVKTGAYKNKIVKIEDFYREAGNAQDFYNRWNKIFSENGIFENWVQAYNYQNKFLTKKDLKKMTDDDSTKIFNRFESILRKHSVSDAPNAFNKIFNLFLAKIFDEKKRETDELDFQWKQGKDDCDDKEFQYVDFQIRLINLYKNGMKEFLRKEVEGIKDDDFEITSPEIVKKLKKKFLIFQNVFAIKEVFDNETFEENSRVLKEVVEMLSEYQIRYPRKQQHLSNFFERLLTTGLKQKSGQFFTPPPIARFVIRSIPFKEIMTSMLANNEIPKLPAMIDYAAGSGHFLTETMEEMQNIIDDIKTDDFFPDVKKQVEVWKLQKYDWASRYIYGIEKDYRLVKTAKVGCYFYGDGLAQVIYGDGLDNFTYSKNYRGLLKQKEENKNLEKFNFVLSNPPYSVDNFKGDIKNKYPKKSFSLYENFTDNSSEIEVLFIERTAQLLKVGGIAGIILPSSILSNAGFYTKAREIILEQFEIISITELGSNTFMATGTNTVVLFLRKRKKGEIAKFKKYIDDFFVDKKDRTINGVENAISKYAKETFENMSFEEYTKYCDSHKEIEKEKMFYFVLTYSQKVILVKSGEKKAEKEFLGYEFSNRRGSEGMHPIQRGKTVDECTSLYDISELNNPEKASTYIYDAFLGNFDREIPESLSKNIRRVNLVDLLTFDREKFDKNISLNKQEKVRYEELWGTDNLVPLGEISKIQKGTSITSRNIVKGEIPVVAGGKEPAYFHNIANREGNVITVSASGANAGFINYFENPIFASDCNTIISKEEANISTQLILIFLKSIQKTIYGLQRGQAQPHVYGADLAMVKIPLPPLEIQKKIIAEVGKLDEKFATIRMEIEEYNAEIKDIFEKFDISVGGGRIYKLSDVTSLLRRGKSATYGTSNIQIIKSGQARGYREFDFSEKHFVNEKFILDERQLQKGDILINSTGVGTAGRVTLFDLDGVFVADSHITIVRLNKDYALPLYILYALADIGFKNIERMAEGQSGQIELSLGIINNIKIPLPPLEIQKEIVRKIEKIEEKIQKLQTELENIPKQKEEILKKYL